MIDTQSLESMQDLVFMTFKDKWNQTMALFKNHGRTILSTNYVIIFGGVAIGVAHSRHTAQPTDRLTGG